MNQTNVNDFNQGQKERMIGYYDKWYRYNRSDDGAAYSPRANKTGGQQHEK